MGKSFLIVVALLVGCGTLLVAQAPRTTVIRAARMLDPVAGRLVRFVMKGGEVVVRASGSGGLSGSGTTR